MIVINWNISWLNETHEKIQYLQKIVKNQSFILVLQEVKQNAYELLKESFAQIANVEYSLEYRMPGKYDTDSRRLGIAIVISKDMRILEANVLERALMPDRTLMVDVEYQQQKLRVLGLHSITGCQHGKAKEMQYFTFAEAIDELKPDIVGIDANEPEFDHYEIAKMKFFDNYNKGTGCKTFFEAMQVNGLEDAFVKRYNKDNYVEGEYLTTSHIIKRGNKKVRYDFVFVNSDKINIDSCVYDYNTAVDAGSDHAAIILNTEENKKEKDWGLKIREARKKFGITQEQLADMLGVHRSTIANYEIMRRKPTFLELKKLTEILGVDINYILENEAESSTEELIKYAKSVFGDSALPQEEKDSLFREIMEIYMNKRESV